MAQRSQGERRGRRNAAAAPALHLVEAAPTPAGRPRLSIVAPCYNEEAVLQAFVTRMTGAAQAACGEDFELILVNDGSRDATWAMIRMFAFDHPNIVGVNLARNHGHQLAVTAGLSLARGDHVLVIDADLQDPPEVLGEMMAKARGGCDVVYGRRRARQGEKVFKLATARIFYGLLGRIAEIDIPPDTGDFRLMSHRIVERLNAMPEQDRFLRGMVAWLGGRQEEVLYDRDPRYAGKTGYTLARMVRLALDGLTSFSTAPLRLAVLMSFLGVGVAVILAAYIVGSFLLSKTVHGWTSLALIVVFFSTAQLICLAVFGEYLGRIYMQGKSRPLFLIDEVARGRGHQEREPS